MQCSYNLQYHSRVTKIDHKVLTLDQVADCEDRFCNRD